MPAKAALTQRRGRWRSLMSEPAGGGDPASRWAASQAPRWLRLVECSWQLAHGEKLSDLFFFSQFSFASQNPAYRVESVGFSWSRATIVCCKRSSGPPSTNSCPAGGCWRMGGYNIARVTRDLSAVQRPNFQSLINLQVHRGPGGLSSSTPSTAYCTV